uniref:MPLKI protein n=1 Tax=Steinernema glaseri TaxID=37863 RepID=A0A1I7Y726_9BILA
MDNVLGRTTSKASDNFFNNRGGGWRGGRGEGRGSGPRRGGFQQRGRGGGFNQGGYNHRGGRRGNHQQNFQRRRPYSQVSNETGTKPTDYRSYVLPQMMENPWAALEAQYGLPPAFVPSSCQKVEDPPSQEAAPAPPKTEDEAPEVTA